MLIASTVGYAADVHNILRAHLIAYHHVLLGFFAIFRIYFHPILGINPFVYELSFREIPPNFHLYICLFFSIHSFSPPPFFCFFSL